MLSILCVTKDEEHTNRFLNEMCELKYGLFANVEIFHDETDAGYLESVLDMAIEKCKGDYILRLDDDETLSPELVEWLAKGEFEHEVYTFPRLNLWGDEKHYITNSPLFPDFQTRLTTKAKAGGRDTIHAGSPFGTGIIIPHPILHHKFLVRTHDERLKQAERYESIQQGAGLGFYKVYTLPEDCLEIKTAEL